MTPADLKALREVPGCGKVVATLGAARDGNPLVLSHRCAAANEDRCDDCLALLAEAVIRQAVERMSAGVTYIGHTKILAALLPSPAEPT